MLEKYKTDVRQVYGISFHKAQRELDNVWPIIHKFIESMLCMEAFYEYTGAAIEKWECKSSAELGSKIVELEAKRFVDQLNSRISLCMQNGAEKIEEFQDSLKSLSEEKMLELLANIEEDNKK